MVRCTFATPRKVHPVLAGEIAGAFLAARNSPHDPTVRAAYGQLMSQSDQVFAALTRRRRAAGIRVVFTRCRMPYTSDREMIAAVRGDRLLEVTVAAVEPDRRHPLMGCEVGGAYDRFRAVHDIVGHVAARFGFDRDGEFSAWLTQERFYRGLARWALATELHAEHSVRWTTGALADHKAILLDRGLLARARRA
jgi:hypothetical protein